MNNNIGKLILKKNSVLYCKSDFDYEKIIEQQKNKNSFLHYILFHPSQLKYSRKLYKILLKKDIILFCEFEIFTPYNNKFTVITPIKKIIDNDELYEINYIKLKENNYDGIIRPQLGYAKNFEISLFNDETIFDIDKIENIKNWNNLDIIQCCGNYPICFTYIKPIFNLNIKYKKIINLFLNNLKNNIEFKSTSMNFFDLLLIYSEINYQ